MTNIQIRKSTADGRVPPLPCGDIKWRDEKKYVGIWFVEMKQAEDAETAPRLAFGMGYCNIYGDMVGKNPFPEGSGSFYTGEPRRLKKDTVPSGILRGTKWEV